MQKKIQIVIFVDEQDLGFINRATYFSDSNQADRCLKKGIIFY